MQEVFDDANNLVNSVEKDKTSQSEKTEESRPFDKSLLDVPSIVERKQIESANDPASKKSLILLHENLCDLVEQIDSKLRRFTK